MSFPAPTRPDLVLRFKPDNNALYFRGSRSYRGIPSDRDFHYFGRQNGSFLVIAADGFGMGEDEGEGPIEVGSMGLMNLVLTMDETPFSSPTVEIKKPTIFEW